MFNILKLNLELELAQKTTLDLMLTAIAEISGKSNLHLNDMDEHIAFVLDRLTQYDWAQNPFLLAKIKAAIQARFPMHLTSEIQNNIKIDKIEYAPIGATISLIGNIEQQYKNQTIILDFYGQRKRILLNTLPKNMWFSFPRGRTCGRKYSDSLRIISEDGLVIFKDNIEHIHQAISFQHVDNQLLSEKHFSTEQPQFIFDVHFDLARDLVLENVKARIDTDHPYPNDLAMQILDPNNIILATIIGVDEDQLPVVNLGTLNRLKYLKINAQDVRSGHAQTWLKFYASYDKLKLECR